VPIRIGTPPEGAGGVFYGSPSTSVPNIITLGNLTVGTLTVTSNADIATINMLSVTQTADLTLANGDNSNIVVGQVSFIRTIIGPTGAFAITGFVPTRNGQILMLMYNGGQAFTLAHNRTSSAANRIFCPGAGDMTPSVAYGTVTLLYNGGIPGWTVLSRL